MVGTVAAGLAVVGTEAAGLAAVGTEAAGLAAMGTEMAGLVAVAAKGVMAGRQRHREGAEAAETDLSAADLAAAD